MVQICGRSNPDLVLYQWAGSVAGWGDRATSFCCRAVFMHRLNAYILVLSLTPDCQAWWVQSWYQSLNSWLPIYVSCILSQSDHRVGLSQGSRGLGISGKITKMNFGEGSFPKGKSVTWGIMWQSGWQAKITQVRRDLESSKSLACDLKM